MGVQGLWRLIEPSGKPVPLESLENKVLAVDISIWLHQAVKGFQDAKGAPLPNAHLLGVFHRVCKLLYYRIRPVFVFDGGVPVLKRQTIAKRNQQKTKNLNDANHLQKQLLNSLLKHSAINVVLSEKAKAALENDIQKASGSGNVPDVGNDMFDLPPSQVETTAAESDDDDDDTSSDDDHLHVTRHMDLHTIDEKSARFKNLPANIRHEILSDLKETRKQSSWGRIHELPTQSDDFAGYQMKRLLKRHSVQVSLEEAEKEMGGFTLSLEDLEKLLTNHGVITSTSIVTRRIASDENKRYVYIKNLKEAIEQASVEKKNGMSETQKKEEDDEDDVVSMPVEMNENAESEVSEKEGVVDEGGAVSMSVETTKEGAETQKESGNKSGKSIADVEFEEDLEKAIKLSLEDDQVEVKTPREDELVEPPKEKFEEVNSEAVEENIKNPETSNNKNSNAQHLVDTCNISKSRADEEYEKDLEEAIRLSLEDTATTSMLPESMLVDDDDDGNDSNEDTGDPEMANRVMATAKSYMTEYSGLTPAEILKIIGINSGGVSNGNGNLCRKTDAKDELSSKPKVKEVERINFSKLLTRKMAPSEDLTPTSTSLGKSKVNIRDSSCPVVNDLVGDTGAEQTPDGPVGARVMSKMNTGELDESVEKSKVIGSDLKEGCSFFADHFEHDTSKKLEIPPDKNNKIALFTSPTVQLISDSEVSEDDFQEVGTSIPLIDKKNQPQKFISIPNDQEPSDSPVVDLMSDSEDDLVEVETPVDPHDTKNQLQPSLHITIEKVSSLQDDLFSDIFEKMGSKEEETLVCEEGQDLGKDQPKKKLEQVPPRESVRTPEKLTVPMPDELPEKDSALLKEILKPSISKGENLSKLTTSELKKIQKDLDREREQLISEKSTKERLVGNITDQMYQEAQELLQLFGVPYVIAPMEAEAQCAFLNDINMTDGTITDDSDVWLFGAKTVYKNFFNQSKLVMEFKSEEIQHSFKLSRHEMILLALLVGSDYTTGIQGIGPVTALEILASFPPPKNELTFNHLKLLQGLREFRRWFNTKNGTSKPIRTALRNKLKNVEISDQFPSLQVVQAYLKPAVETSRETFSWQKPDLGSLTEFAKHKFGWSQKKSEEILKPVLRRLEDTAVQAKITNYFKTKYKIRADLPDGKMSKRVKKAVSKMGNNGDEESPDESSEPKKKKVVRKATDNSEKKRGRKKIAGEKPPINEDETDEPVITNDEDIRTLLQTKKFSRHKVKEMKIQLNEMLLKAEAEAQASPKPSGEGTRRLHRKETIPQKERDRTDSLRNKLKAIEVFRKSKRGPGFVQRKQKSARQPKQDAELSESSDTS